MKENFLKRRAERVSYAKNQRSRMIGDTMLSVIHKAKNESQEITVKDLLLEYNSGIDFDILSFNESTQQVEYTAVCGVFLVECATRVYRFSQTQQTHLQLTGTCLEIMINNKTLDPRAQWCVASIISPLSSVMILDETLKTPQFVENWMIKNLDEQAAVYEVIIANHAAIFANNILIKVETQTS